MAGGDGQRLIIRQRCDLFSREVNTLNLSRAFSDGMLGQCGRKKVMVIPIQKVRLGMLNITQITEVVAIPKASTPQTIDKLDSTVELGFADGDEDGFDAGIQA